MTETCNTCRFWEPAQEDDAIGQCRRLPPVMVERMLMAIDDLRVGETLVHRAHQASMFPVTADHAWCGKYREAEWSLQQVRFLRELDSDVERLKYLAGRLTAEIPSNASDVKLSENRAIILMSARMEVGQLKSFGEELVKRRGPDGPSEVYERARDPEDDVLQAAVVVAWAGMDGFGPAVEEVDDDVAF